MTEKYIRTFYNDEKVIMRLSGCQFCPLMRFDMINTRCLCRYFSDETESPLVDVFVLDYSDKGVVHDKIKIPKWCGLSDTIDELIWAKTTYRAFPSSVITNEEDDCDNDKLPFIDAEERRNEEDILFDKFLIQLIQKPSDLNGESVDIHRLAFPALDTRDFTNSTEYDEAKYGYQEPIIKHEVCSLCGEEDETVKRKEKYGMCDDCWEEFQFDEEKKKQAFINNFRMKRNKDFPKESFKTI